MLRALFNWISGLLDETACEPPPRDTSELVELRDRMRSSHLEVFPVPGRDLTLFVYGGPNPAVITKHGSFAGDTVEAALTQVVRTAELDDLRGILEIGGTLQDRLVAAASMLANAWGSSPACDDPGRRLIVEEFLVRAVKLDESEVRLLRVPGRGQAAYRLLKYHLVETSGPHGDIQRTRSGGVILTWREHAEDLHEGEPLPMRV